MPHASRKQKLGPKKRLQITDDSGWTHVTKGTGKQKHQHKSAAWSIGDQEFRPTIIPRGLTLQEVFNSFERYTIIWKESSSLKNLKGLLENHVLVSNIKITNCVCLGLGSFTGGDRTEISFFQLAALVSTLEILGQYIESF